MRILITGGAGQVGWELCRTLAVHGEILAPARNELDLASADSIVAAVRAFGPELIVNAAAYTAVDTAESQAELAAKVNGDAPRIMAEEAARLGAGMVHFSTDYVFDGTKIEPYVEDDKTSPINVYGRTKLAGERGVAGAIPAHLILRTSWVYGPRGRNFLLTVLRLAHERKELKVVDDQYGAPTPARLIAEATACIVAQLSRRAHLNAERLEYVGGTYHLTSAGRTTWYDFAREILQGRQDASKVVPITTAEYPSPARRPRNCVLENGKLRQAFGIELPDWKTGLRLCLEDLG
jgi:dTDP-4-dehydrorhamnose reductase